MRESTARLRCVRKDLVQRDMRQITPKSRNAIFANQILVQRIVCSCNLHYRLHVTLVMSHSVCFCKEQKKEQQQKNTDESTVDLTAPECCLLHWEGFKRLQDVAMERIFEGTNKACFSVVSQMSSGAFPEMDKVGCTRGGERPFEHD